MLGTYLPGEFIFQYHIFLSSQNGRIEGRALFFSCKNSKITTCCWTTIDRKMLDSTKKNTLPWRTKEKPQQHSRRVKITFRANPIPTRDAWRAQTKPCAQQETPAETEPDLSLSVCLLQRYRSAVACHRGRGSGCNSLWCGINPLGGSHLNSTIEPLSRWPTNCRTIIPKKFSQC